MELSEEEKKAIEYLKDDIKSYVYLLNNNDKQKDYYIKEYPNMEAKRILLNLVERQQEEIDTWKETKNDYEHELARKEEEIEEMQEELEIQKRLIIEQIKRFCELYKPKEGIGEGGLDELADKILSFSKDYISKDKIRELIKKYKEKYNNYPNYTLEDFGFRQEYLHKFRVLEELLEENNEKSNTL